jgi:uncharacterized protein YkwD
LSPVTRTGAPSRARILVVAIIAALAAGLSLVAPQGAHAATAPTYAQMMQRVVDDTNAVRAGAGLRPLVRNADLDRVAANWALQQWKNGTMSHNPSFSTQIPSGWSRAGENVAKGYTYLQVVPAWKASPGHYANIVNDYTSIGIGYYEQDGRRYWCQLFAKYPGVTQPALVQPATIPTHIPVPTQVRTESPRNPEVATPTSTSTSMAGPIASVEVDIAVDGPDSSTPSGTRSLPVQAAPARPVPAAPARAVVQTASPPAAAGSTPVSTLWVLADSAAPKMVRLPLISSWIGMIAAPSADSGVPAHRQPRRASLRGLSLI